MTTWEYKTVTLPSVNREDHLNMWGSAGWRLVTIKQGVAYFQRPREVSEPASAPDPLPVPARVQTKLKAK